jgi:ATP-dependent RNA helicase
VILSPTRELASQTAAVAAALGDFLRCRVHALTGGRSQSADIKALESGVHVVSGTPGRVMDMVRRRALACDRVSTLVVDEADEMMGLGLREAILEVYRCMPASAQVVLVSATMTADVIETAHELTTDPVRVMVRREEVTLEGIAQYRVDVGIEAHKYPTLCDLYASLSVAQCVVFCNTRKRVTRLAEQLREGGFAVAMLHGEMTQAERDAVMAGFRGGRSRVLVTTDIMARGIDVSQVSCVINYDIPTSREVYVHRIGRSGRFGRKGVAINFVNDDDTEAVEEIEAFYDITIAALPARIEGVFAALG